MENRMSIEKAAASRTNSHGSVLVWLVVMGLIVWGAAAGLSALSEWVTSNKIKNREEELRTGKVVDESTVVLSTFIDASGARPAYYKLGHGVYAQALRVAGIGCRFYTPGGAIYTFVEKKTTDPIPFDTFQPGALVKGSCDAEKIEGFDLARAQK